MIVALNRTSTLPGTSNSPREDLVKRRFSEKEAWGRAWSAILWQNSNKIYAEFENQTPPLPKKNTPSYQVLERSDIKIYILYVT